MSGYRRYDFSGHCENQVSDLRPHPLNARVYGETEPDDALLNSVAEHGVFNPIVINRSKEILSGHRRWLAAKAAGFKKVPVICLLEDEGNGLLSELFLLESNRQREKTPEQKGREFIELKRIETALAEQRQAATRKRGDKAPVTKNFTERDKGEAAVKAAAAVGMSRPTANKLEAVIEAADRGDEKAKTALRNLEQKKGRGIDAAYRAVVQPKTAPAPPTSLEKTMAKALREWAKTECPLVRAFVVQPSAYGVDARSATGSIAFDVQFRSVSAEEVKVVVAALQNFRKVSHAA